MKIEIRRVRGYELLAAIMVENGITRFGPSVSRPRDDDLELRIGSEQIRSGFDMGNVFQL